MYSLLSKKYNLTLEQEVRFYTTKTVYFHTENTRNEYEVRSDMLERF